MRRIAGNSVFLFFSLCLPVICFFPAGCVKKPYLTGDVFEHLKVSAESDNRCTAVLSGEKVDYFLCEPRNKTYKIKIIPSENNTAVLLIVPDQGIPDDYFESVLQKDIRQAAVNVSCVFGSSNISEDLRKGKSTLLTVKSLDKEKYQIEGIFIVDKFLTHQGSTRGRLK